MYLKYFSALLEAEGRPSLPPGVTIVPVGGLDKVATFVALLSVNDLELAVLHDYAGAPDQRIDDLVKRKLIVKKRVLDYSMFTSGNTPTDVEDLITTGTYVRYFNDAYSKELAGHAPKVSDLPPGDRIVERLTRWMEDKGVSVRPSGGFNHFRVASRMVETAPKVDRSTLDRFEQLFHRVGSVFAAGAS